MNILEILGVIGFVILITLFTIGKINEEKCIYKGYNGYQYEMGCYTRVGENLTYEKYETR